MKQREKRKRRKRGKRLKRRRTGRIKKLLTMNSNFKENNLRNNFTVEVIKPRADVINKF